MTTAVSLRPVLTSDAEALALLHVEVWEAAYRGLMPEHVFTERRAGLGARADRWREIIATSPARTLVAVASMRVMFFAFFSSVGICSMFPLM